MSRAKQHWFWAYVVELTVPKPERSEECELWKNLILVRAHDAEQAYKKAVRIGELAEGDYSGSLHLDGKPAIRIFIGLAGLGLVHDPIKDGCEILWNLERCSRSEAVKKVRSKEDLIASATKELKYRMGSVLK